MLKILFVCTGNTCRSPMAQGIFRKIVEDNGDTGVYCMSVGIATIDGQKATENAIKACAEIGVDISAHRSKSMANIGNLSTFDVYVVMTATHAYVLKQAGVPDEKLCVLGNEISDPYGGDLETYRKCRDQIKEALLALYQQLKAGKMIRE